MLRLKSSENSGPDGGVDMSTGGGGGGVAMSAGGGGGGGVAMSTGGGGGGGGAVPTARRTKSSKGTPAELVVKPAEPEVVIGEESVTLMRTLPFTLAVSALPDAVSCRVAAVSSAATTFGAV